MPPFTHYAAGPCQCLNTTGLPWTAHASRYLGVNAEQVAAQGACGACEHLPEVLPFPPVAYVGFSGVHKEWQVRTAPPPEDVGPRGFRLYLDGVKQECNTPCDLEDPVYRATCQKVCTCHPVPQAAL